MNFIFKEKLGFQHTKITYIEDKKYFLLDILLLAVLRKIECSLGRGDRILEGPFLSRKIRFDLIDFSHDIRHNLK